jgi:hypothetical protein
VGRTCSDVRCGVSERDWPAALDQRIEDVATARDPSEVSRDVRRIALDHSGTSRAASRLFSIWDCLGASSTGAMREAAREWSAARDDAAARDAYLDRWEAAAKVSLGARSDPSAASQAIVGHGRRSSSLYVSFPQFLDLVVRSVSYVARLMGALIRAARDRRRRNSG